MSWDEVSETWYLDPQEWAAFSAELRTARTVWKRLTVLVHSRQTIVLQRVKKNTHIAKALRMEPLLNTRILEIKAKFQQMKRDGLDDLLAQWKQEREEYFAEGRAIRRLIDDGRKQKARKDPQFRRLQRVQKEAAIYVPMMMRLAMREKILMRAIQAGLFLTAPEVQQLSTISHGKFIQLVRKFSEVT